MTRRDGRLFTDGRYTAQAAEEVKRLAYELHANGIALARRHMRPLLTSSDYLNLEEGRAALRAVRQELGL